MKSCITKPAQNQKIQHKKVSVSGKSATKIKAVEHKIQSSNPNVARNPKCQQNEDIDWLQKIVNGFTWYKDPHDPLFIDQCNSLSKFCTNQQIFKARPDDNTQRFSQRKQLKQITDNIVTDSKKNLNKIKENKSQQFSIVPRNTGNVVFSVKSKRSESEGSVYPKKKQYSIYIPYASCNKIKLIEKQKLKQKQKQIEDYYSTQKQKYQLQDRNRPYSLTKNQPPNTDYKNAAQIIEVSGIQDNNNDLIVLKNKLSMPQAKNMAKLNNKIANIRAQRKNFIQSVTQCKSNFGKIVKNKSVQLKQRNRTSYSTENRGFGKQNQDNKKQQQKQTEKSNSKIIQKLQQKYLVKDFNESIQNQHSRVKQIEQKHNQIQKLLIKPKQPPKQKPTPQIHIFRIKNECLAVDQKQNSKQNTKTYIQIQKQRSAQKQKQKQVENWKQNSGAKNQIQHKKYNYLIQKSVLQNRADKLSKKKQRKLNSSFGERKLIYNYGEARSIENLSSFRKIEQNRQQMPKQIQNNVVHTISFSTKKPNSSFYEEKQNCMFKIGQKNKSDEKKSKTQNQILVPSKKQQNYIQIPDKKEKVQKVIETKNDQKQKFTQICQNVKFVESTKNSQVLTEQSFVIDKQNTGQNLLASTKTYSDNSKAAAAYNMNQEWSITEIFKRLDSRKTGVLTANNCSIQYISRQIRYILGPVLEQILYKNVQLDFNQFLQKVQKILDQVKDSQMPHYEPEKYLKIKQWAAETQRPAQQIQKNESYHKHCMKKYSNFQQILYINSTLTDGQSSIASKSGHNSSNQLVLQKDYTSSNKKKYEYQTTFIDGISTQPPMKKKQKKQVIRFATFQDEDNEQSDKNNSLFIKNDFQDRPANQNQDTTAQDGFRKQSRQQKLQRKLQALNQFSSTFGANLKQKQKDNFPSQRQKNEKQLNSFYMGTNVKSRCTSQSSKADYKKQIIKLQMLNQRLEKYLQDQTMKQFSTSKLFIQDI